MISLPLLQAFFNKQNLIILDGGLATELEAQGHLLQDKLWSARLLASNPEAIRDVHLSYLRSGADCITAASYQASLPGFQEAGFTKGESESLLRKSVDLACEAKDIYLKEKMHCDNQNPDPLVAASVGPYGAWLANGSEYTGNYGVSCDVLHGFHKPRFEILSSTPADIYACESIPSYDEAVVLRNLLAETPGIIAWVSFTCRDGEHISDGTPLQECAAIFNDCDVVAAIGVNCTAPKLVKSLIEKIKLGAPAKMIVVYPNSGERYCADTKTWTGESEITAFSTFAEKWFNAGARLIGGCCRTTPGHITALKRALLK